MPIGLRAILVIPDPATNQDLVKALAAFPAVEIVRQVLSYPSPDDFLRIIRAHSPECVFLSADDLAESLAPAIARHHIPPPHKRKFLEFFQVPRDEITTWYGRNEGILIVMPAAPRALRSRRRRRTVPHRCRFGVSGGTSG